MGEIKYINGLYVTVATALWSNKKVTGLNSVSDERVDNFKEKQINYKYKKEKQENKKK